MLWLTPDATEMTEQDWNFPNGRFLSYVLGARRAADSRRSIIVLNAAPEAIAFTLPTVPECTPLDESARYGAAAPHKRAAPSPPARA